jgi:hypothetical protein
VRWLALVVAAFALLGAGCGGGGNSSTTAAETTTSDTSTTETTTTETTTAEDTTGGETTDTTDLSAVLGDKDCLALASVGATMSKAFSANGTTGDTSELDALASKVPDEIKPDVETLAQAFSEYASKLKDIGITPGSTPSADQLKQLQAALVSLDQQKLTAASAHIQAWAKQNCTG